MPPPNTTPATAIDISSIPYDTVQTGIHDAGTTFTVWYKHTSDGTEGVVGEMFRGAGAYAPTVNVYIDDEFTLLGSISANRMSQTPDLNGRLYLFEVVPNGGNPNPATLTVSLVKQPRIAHVRGDIFIRAASILPSFTSAGYTGLGGGVINPTTGVIKNFDPVFQVGESGDYLPTGELCFADEQNAPFDKIRLYAPTVPLTLSATVTYDWKQSFPVIRSWREGFQFLVVDKGQAAVKDVTFFTISRTGVMSAETTLAGQLGCTAAAMSVAGDKVYLSGIAGSGNSNIKVWNIAGAAFDADLAATIAGHITRDILVMSNGNLIVLYHDSTVDSIFARIYTPAGAVVATYTVPIPVGGFTSIAPRLGYANDNSLTFWIFPHASDGFSYFKQVDAATGLLVHSIESPDSTYFQTDRGLTPTFRLVTSDSCPFVLLLPTQGGILTVDPDSSQIPIPPSRRDKYYNDVELKIPNPTVRTALIGE